MLEATFNTKLRNQISILKNSLPKNLKMDKELMKQIRTFGMLATNQLVNFSKPFPLKVVLSSAFMNFKEKKSMLLADYKLYESAYNTMLAYDFRKNMKFEVPVHFIYGNEDVNCPAELLVQSFDGISAPDKKIDIIENASHMCFYDKSEEFLLHIQVISKKQVDQFLLSQGI